MLADKFWEEGIFDAAGFQHKYNPHDATRSLRTMAWRLKNEGLNPHCTAKVSHMGSRRRVPIFFVAIAHQEGVVLCEQYEGKLMEICSQISSKHTFKKLSVDGGFQKAKGFFKMDVLCKTVKKQNKLWIQLEQSNLAYLLVHRISIL